MLIPSSWIKKIFFPGSIIKAISKGLFAEEILHVTPKEYLIGFVNTDFPVWKLILINFFPFLMNSLLAAFFFATALFFNTGIISVIFFYLGLSLAVHAFPDNKISTLLWTKGKILVKEGDFSGIICFPFVLFIKIANLLNFFWFDVIYGLLIFFAVAEAMNFF